MVVVPNAPAVTTPVVAIIEATAILLLDHVPPGGVAVSVVVVPAQIDDGGGIVGSGLIVT